MVLNALQALQAQPQTTRRGTMHQPWSFRQIQQCLHQVWSATWAEAGAFIRCDVPHNGQMPNKAQDTVASFQQCNSAPEVWSWF